MELVVRSRNLDVSDPARDYAQRKLARFGRLVPRLAEATVELAREGARDVDERFAVQVTLRIGSTVLRVEERASNLFAAIDLAAATLRSRVERYRTRLYGRGRARPKGATPEVGVGYVETEEATPNVVRVKRFSIEPTTPVEAIHRMELLGHSFYFFFDVESEQYAVIYRRADGDYGLIEPEAPQ